LCSSSKQQQQNRLSFIADSESALHDILIVIERLFIVVQFAAKEMAGARFALCGF
jgi:hypothetical protein